MRLIADALGAVARITSKGLHTLEIPGQNREESNAEFQSQSNLIEFSRTYPYPPADGFILSMWQDHIEQSREHQQEAARHRGEGSKPVTIEEWKRRYLAKDGRLF